MTRRETQTANRGQQSAATEPKVCGLRYVALGVEDLDRERTFFREVWGLRELSVAGDCAYFAAEGSPEPFVLRLRRNAAKRLDLIGFAAASCDSVDALSETLQAQGVKISSGPGPLTSPGGGYGLRFFDPDGHTIEVSADVEAGPCRALNRRESIPVRLSHVVLHAADVAASAAFYERTLGLRTSDWLAQFMCFLRCDTAHHRLALLPGLPNLNHIAFDVQNLDELMRGISRLSMAGIKLEWGPGRHTAGANIFAYFRTPSGVTLEYTAELEQVNEDTWQPTVYPLTPEITDQWGTGRLFIDSSPQFPQQPDPGLWTPPPC